MLSALPTSHQTKQPHSLPPALWTMIMGFSYVLAWDAARDAERGIIIALLVVLAFTKFNTCLS